MFPFVLHLYLLGRTTRRSGMESIRLSMLQERDRPRTERPETEGAEGGQTGQTGVRGYVHDGGQGLGGRADIGTDNYWKNSGKNIALFPGIGVIQ